MLRKPIPLVGIYYIAARLHSFERWHLFDTGMLIAPRLILHSLTLEI